MLVIAVEKQRYRVYSDHLKEKFGGKVYKLPINLPGTCPNRDGNVGTGGCIFCDEQGAGFECLPSSLSVQEQLAANRDFFRRRYKAEKFIVYFQAFTNTYLPFDRFREYVLAAAEGEDVVGISISTRPDCVNDRYLDFLAEVAGEKGLDMNIELGLQTVNYHSLLRVNRGHTLAEFLDAVQRIKGRGFAVCVHLILNLPWDDMTDVVENAKILSVLGVQYVKLHSLYVVRDTVLGKMYEKGEFTIITLAEYVDRVVTFLEHLHPAVVVQRLVGRGPYDRVLFSNWGVSWWQVKQGIESRLEELDTYQGRRCDYLNGPALRRRFDPGEE
ncbi:TIGR01212 family radical SAM protein [Desulfofundulus thermobenzoicus]|uniref:TIGR01212 family radical SAM protein n=1 Tax=Desulfofundulus thermobenzoicus TaxID=29376 RepID=A0A6N7IPY5_9FIRM|nr:TIGR01212 family radical SAM protein [Desulfofundulus thermobenzoicus]MQL52092.1 TIGR01212 family radical SAM protein [Desulfofundulus thermobenzoicus]